MAQRIVEAATKPGGLRPAEFLRDLRAEAVAKVMAPGLQPQERQLAMRRLIYTFLYVFYGSPWARLQVIS